MNLLLTRFGFGETFTIGKLFVNNIFFCHTLEDKCREYEDNREGFQIAYEKVEGETAIPTGTYNIVVTYSNKFQKFLPLVEHVPGFEGIRIHAGNTNKDTEGCILVGNYKEDNPMLISNSRATLNKLQPKIQDTLIKGELVTITIVNQQTH